MASSRKKKEKEVREFFFLPPLKMVLSENESGQPDEENRKPKRVKAPDMEIVTRLIEKLSRKDE